MTTEEWISLYDKLNDYYGDFKMAYSDMEKGSNQKIRENGERKVTNVIDNCDYLLRTNSEFFKLAFGESNRINYSYEEFKIPHNFNRDLGPILNKVKNQFQS